MSNHMEISRLTDQMDAAVTKHIKHTQQFIKCTETIIGQLRSVIEREKQKEEFDNLMLNANLGVHFSNENANTNNLPPNLMPNTESLDMLSKYECKKKSLQIISKLSNNSDNSLNTNSDTNFSSLNSSILIPDLTNGNKNTNQSCQSSQSSMPIVTTKSVFIPQSPQKKRHKKQKRKNHKQIPAKEIALNYILPDLFANGQVKIDRKIMNYVGHHSRTTLMREELIELFANDAIKTEIGKKGSFLDKSIELNSELSEIEMKNDPLNQCLKLRCSSCKKLDLQRHSGCCATAY